MIVFIEISFLIIAILIILPMLLLFVESAAALLPSKSPPSAAKAVRPRVVVLVPAHNEADGIAATLAILLPQLIPGDRLIAIADNCTDDTAEIARSWGVTVLERHDSRRRGKGYALDYGLQFIAADPPDVVVIIDADTHVQPGSLEQIALLAWSSGRPVQAIYLLAQPARHNPKSAVSAFAFMFKNLVRSRGLARMGLPCMLHGTGMALPWSLVGRVSFASGNIVEDMQLGLDLARAGYPPLFCANAKVTGVLPQSQQAAKSQRTRWEHGHLQTLRTQVPQLLTASVQQRRLDLMAMALDLCIPPLSLLVLMWLVGTAISLILGGLGLSWLSAKILGVGGIWLLLSILLAWAKFGTKDLSIGTLLTIPMYVLWKIPIYLAVLVRPQTEWIRTERDPK